MGVLIEMMFNMVFGRVGMMGDDILGLGLVGIFYNVIIYLF